MQILLIGLLIVVYLISLQHIKAVETSIYVDDDNITGPWLGTQTYPFQTIQDALDNASEHDIIRVLAGNYTGTLQINKTIRLIGSDKTQTKVIGSMQQPAIYITAWNVTLSGFTITNSSVGITLINTTNTTITNNTFINNLLGVEIDAQSNDNLIFYNNFLQNSVHAEDLGVNNWSDQEVTQGNFWSGFSTIDVDNDSISDNPYQIPGGINQDFYPLLQPVTKLPQPGFTYTPLQPTTQDVIQFNDTSKDDDGKVVSWQWNFGDLNTSQEQHPTHRFSDNGVYQVTLTVTDNYGATVFVKRNITVYNTPPIAGFTYLPLQPNDIEPVQFSDSSEDVDGVISSWYWVFGDGNSSNEQNPNHRYEDDGLYTVVLQVTDDDFDMHQITQQIKIVNVPPAAKFTFNPVEPTINDTVKFSDHSSDGDGDIVSWLWDFDDGETSEVKSPQHHFPGEGTYQVTLVIVDDDGASSTISKFVIVYPLEPPTQTIEQTLLIYIFYLVMFIAMIALVFFIIKKSKK